jgi:hypothetical protein
MRRPLDTLRALARRESSTPPPEGLLSLNSFISSSGTRSTAAPKAAEPAKSAAIDTKETKEVEKQIHGRVCGGNERNEKNEITPLTIGDPEERAALVEYGAGIPRAWAEGFAALCTMPAPIGFSPERWQRTVDAAGIFLDRWADTAITCGWTDLDVFGCDPDRPDARFDCMGLVMLLDRCTIVGIDENGADLVITGTGSRQRYRRRQLPASTVSLWELIKLGK